MTAQNVLDATMERLGFGRRQCAAKVHDADGRFVGRCLRLEGHEEHTAGLQADDEPYPRRLIVGLGHRLYGAKEQ